MIEKEKAERLVKEALSRDVGLNAIEAIFGKDKAFTLVEIDRIGSYVIDERWRKYAEGKRDQLSLDKLGEL